MLAATLCSVSAFHNHPRITCRLRLDWTTPEEQRSPENKYRLAAQGSDGKFYRLQNLVGRAKAATAQGAGKTHFSVPMWRFFQEPFNLKDGDNVVVRVSAKMPGGWGPYEHVNQWNSASTVFAPPRGADGLRAEKVTATGLTLAWEALPGGRPTDHYQVFMSAGPSEPWKAVGKTKETSFVVDGLADGATYLFRVRAANLCGHTDSDAIFATAGGAPVAVSGSITAQDCNLRISWKALGAASTSDVQIKDAQGEY